MTPGSDSLRSRPARTSARHAAQPRDEPRTTQTPCAFSIWVELSCIVLETLDARRHRAATRRRPGGTFAGCKNAPVPVRRLRPAPHWPLPRDSPVVSTLRYVRAGGTWLSRPHVAFPRARLSASAPSKSRGAGGRTSTCYKPSARRSISRSRSAVSSPAAPAAASCKKSPCSAALPQAGAEHTAASWTPWPSVSAAAAFAPRGRKCATACRGTAGRRGGGAAWASRHARRCSGAWQ